MLIELLVVEVDVKVEGTQILLLSLQVFDTLWVNTITSIPSFYVDIVAGKQDKLYALVLWVELFAIDAQISVPIDTI